MPNVIIVHSLVQAVSAAQAAEAAGQPLMMCSAPGGGGHLGTGWFAALKDLVREQHPALSVTVFLDCGDDAGTAMGALRRGLNVVFSGRVQAFDRLTAIAQNLGLSVERAALCHLDLLTIPDPVAACLKLFDKHDA